MDLEKLSPPQACRGQGSSPPTPCKSSQELRLQGPLVLTLLITALPAPACMAKGTPCKGPADLGPSLLSLSLSPDPYLLAAVLMFRWGCPGRGWG